MNTRQIVNTGSSLEAQIRSINLSQREREHALHAARIAEAFADAVLSVCSTFESAPQTISASSEIEAQIRSVKLSRHECNNALHAARIAGVIVDAAVRICGKRARTISNAPVAFRVPFAKAVGRCIDFKRITGLA